MDIVTVSTATAEETSTDAAVAAVLLGLDGIFTFKRRILEKGLKAFHC